MRRLNARRAAFASPILLLLMLYLAVPLISRAEESSAGCNVVKDPTCTVEVAGGGSNGGTVTTGLDPCAPYPGALYGSKPPAVSQACADELQSNYCNAIVAGALGGLKVGSAADLTSAQVTALNSGLALDGCPAVVTAASLAEQAYSEIVFPHPSGHRSPSETEDYSGYPFTYVGLRTYYWTDPATWRPLSATASAAGLTATVTAVPVSLSFDPGDGSGEQMCQGPGRPWTDADANNAPADGGCAYRYSTVTGPGYDNPITTTQTILWKISWTGTGNTGDDFPSLSTSTSGQLNVLQIETVNR